MDFSLSDEERAIRDTARAFIRTEVMPLEAEVLRRERTHRPGLDRAELRELQRKARTSGFWGLSTPQEYGGMALPAVTQALIWTELGRTVVPFRLPGGPGDGLALGVHPHDGRGRAGIARFLGRAGTAPRHPRRDRPRLRAGHAVDPPGMDPRHSSSMAKLYGAAMANRVVDRVMQIHGGMGYTRELPIERWYR